MVRDTSNEDNRAMVTVRAKALNSSPRQVAHKGDRQEHGNRGEGGRCDGAGNFADRIEDGPELAARRS